jgi:hypothetical protein
LTKVFQVGILPTDRNFNKRPEGQTKEAEAMKGIKFKVEFVNAGNYIFVVNGRAANTKYRNLGLDDVDHIRSVLSVPSLALSRIVEIVSGMMENVRIIITEEVAREVGHFNNDSVVRVTCPSGFCNPAIVETVVSRINKETGEVEEACLVKEIDSDILIGLWKAEGYSLEVTPRDTVDP